VLVDRILPHDMAAEQAVLGSLLIDGGRYADIADLQADDFYREIHGVIYQGICDLWEAGAPIDQVTVAERLGEEVPTAYLAHLVGVVPTSVHAAHYARIVHEKAGLRQAINYAGEIAEAAYGDGATAEDVGLLTVKSGLGLATANGKHAQLRPLRDYADEHFNTLHQVFEGDLLKRGINTRFGQLDYMLGGLQPGQLYIVGARTSMGKSQLLVNIALHAARDGHRVAFFSLEESSDAILSRMISADMGRDWKRLQPAERPHHQQRFDSAYGRISELPIWVTEAAALSTGDMHAQVTLLAAQHDVDLVIVDYLNLASDESPRSRDSRVETVDRITRQLKWTARELKVPLIAAAQLNRETEYRKSREPTLTDLRESGGVEMNADVVMLLYRPWYYVERNMATQKEVQPRGGSFSEEELRVLLRVQIAKNRGGPTGAIDLHYDPATGRVGGWKAQDLRPKLAAGG